jgi:drug efflux transport system ATP-binding protein
VTAVSVDDLTRSFGDLVAVDRVSFEIQRGEVFGLLGANGAGKTTIIRMLCCIYRPTSGRASVLGLDTRESAELIRPRIGYMSQRFSLYGELTVDENLRFYRRVYGNASRELTERVCEQVGLTAAHRATRAEALPTGIRQRAALAAAIAHEPALLFLDEPTSGVDPRSRRLFWELIGRLAAQGTTVLVTTHAMSEAEGCTRVGLMAAGRMVAIGTPRELIDGTGAGIVAVDVSPWQEGYQRLRARWPQAALYGRRVHVLTDSPQHVLHGAGELLADLRVASLAVQRPTLEDAFIWHIGRSRGEGPPRAQT